jgi:hypothetical protein
MITVNLLLMILAAVCFFVSAIAIPVPRVNLIALGLFFWILTAMIR